MVPLVEQDPSWRILAAPSGIDHHQSMVRNDEVGFAARTFGTFDETATIVRAAGIDTFAAPVCERSRSRSPEQAWKPARKVAADHVPVLRIGRPPADQLGEDRSSPGKGALERVLEVQKAQIILAPLSNDDPVRALLGIREELEPFAVELALERLGERRYPNRARRLLGPERRRCKVGERFPNAGSGFRKKHVGCLFRAFGGKHLGDGLSHRPLAFALLGPACQLIELGSSCRGIENDRSRGWPLGRFVPLLQPRKEHPLAAFGTFEPSADQRCPAPSQPH